MPKNPKLKTKPEICLAFLAISCRNHPITGSPDFFIPPLTPLTLRCKGFGFSIFTVWQFWHFWQFPAGITRSPTRFLQSSAYSVYSVFQGFWVSILNLWQFWHFGQLAERARLLATINVSPQH
jgi:hypothetical protein